MDFYKRSEFFQLFGFFSRTSIKILSNNIKDIYIKYLLYLYKLKKLINLSLDLNN